MAKAKKAKKKYRVCVRWMASELVEVEASSVEEAMELAQEVEFDLNNFEFDCPEVDESEVEEVEP